MWNGWSEMAKNIEGKRSKIQQKIFWQKQAKMKRNKMLFTSFHFEAKIKKRAKRDTLLGTDITKVFDTSSNIKVWFGLPSLTQGTDITEAFETSHVFGVPEALLAKYRVRYVFFITN
jgi:hypothetical protein